MYLCLGTPSRSNKGMDRWQGSVGQWPGADHGRKAVVAPRDIRRRSPREPSRHSEVFMSRRDVGVKSDVSKHNRQNSDFDYDKLASAVPFFSKNEASRAWWRASGRCSFFPEVPF